VPQPVLAIYPINVGVCHNLRFNLCLLDIRRTGSRRQLDSCGANSEVRRIHSTCDGGGTAFLLLPHIILTLQEQELDGAHWVHLENPRKFNTAVRKWLQELDSRDSGSGEDVRPNDEL
jgi:hypothetical protein